MLATMSRISKNVEVCMEVGIGNNQRLPVFHAFSGYHLYLSLKKKCKKSPFDILNSSKNFIGSFINISTGSEEKKDIFAEIEEFVSYLYNCKKLRQV